MFGTIASFLNSSIIQGIPLLFGATGEQTESVTTNVKSVDLTSTLKDANNKSGGGQQGGGKKTP